MTADFTFLLISIIIEMEDHIRPHQVIEKHSYQNRPHQFRGNIDRCIPESENKVRKFSYR